MPTPAYFAIAFLVDIREKNDTFGSSLLLANTPMSPKIVNGSFAAIFDAGDFLQKAYAGIRLNVRTARLGNQSIFISKHQSKKYAYWKKN